MSFVRAAIARPQPTRLTEGASRRGRAPGAPVEGSLAQPATHIRRCTFRKVTAVDPGKRQLPMYAVDCLHPTYDSPVPLGDLPAAWSACAACTLPGIFRPDED